MVVVWRPRASSSRIAAWHQLSSARELTRVDAHATTEHTASAAPSGLYFGPPFPNRRTLDRDAEGEFCTAATKRRSTHASALVSTMPAWPALPCGREIRSSRRRLRSALSAATSSTSSHCRPTF